MNFSDAHIIQLWLDLKKGDKNAFSHIIKIHYRTLYNYGTKLTRDKALVEDSIHDIFIDIWRRKAFLSDTQFVKFYLLKALKRKILTKTKRVHFEELLPVYHNSPFFSVESIESEILLEETNIEIKTKLNLAITKLSSREREIIYLKFYQNLNNDEISEILFIKNQSVRNLIFSALSKLKNAMLFYILFYTVQLSIRYLFS